MPKKFYVIIFVVVLFGIIVTLADRHIPAQKDGAVNLSLLYSPPVEKKDNRAKEIVDVTVELHKRTFVATLQVVDCFAGFFRKYTNFEFSDITQDISIVYIYVDADDNKNTGGSTYSGKGDGYDFSIYINQLFMPVGEVIAGKFRTQNLYVEGSAEDELREFIYKPFLSYSLSRWNNKLGKFEYSTHESGGQSLQMDVSTIINQDKIAVIISNKYLQFKPGDKIKYCIDYPWEITKFKAVTLGAR